MTRSGARVMYKMTKFSSPVHRVERDQLILNEDYQDLMRYLGFNCFESVWLYRSGEAIKNIKARSVIRIRIRIHGKEKFFYLKRHNLEYIGLRRLFMQLFPKWILSQGRREFENICDFRRCELPTVIPLAAGEKFVSFFWAESFLITEDFAPFISLEHLLRHHPEFLMGPEGELKKRILIKEIALLARRMHQSGLNHRDFNATHILLHYGNQSDVPQIALFDLQRVDRGRFLRFRWIIKTLAEVIYSLSNQIFNKEDQIYLFKSYKRKEKLGNWDHFQFFWIKRKTARIKRHTEKIMARREARRKMGLMER
jgi:heptose I phosphotransferase